VNVIVVGCGRVGAELALALTRAGQQVCVVDKNEGAFRRLDEGFDGRLVHGSGFDRDDLVAAGIADAHALAAVTAGDNTNILTARIAREVFEVPHVVARIYDPRRAVIYERLGIPTVATVTWTTDQVMRRLGPTTVASEWTAPTGDVVLVERALPDQWAGRALDDLTVAGCSAVSAISRDGTTRVYSPGLVAQPGDIVYLTVRRDALEELRTLLERMPVRGSH
jgi:trk system potassium uptake protein TrkA